MLIAAAVLLLFRLVIHIVDLSRLAENSMIIAMFLTFLLIIPTYSFQSQRTIGYLSLHKANNHGVSSMPFIANLRAQKEDEVEFGEKYEGQIDWDGEWKKVMQNKDQPKDRPGRDFYKSDAEKKIIKVTRSAQEKIIQVQQNIPRLDSLDVRSLQGNTSFWLVVLAIISVGAALIAASGQTSSYTTDSSYYI